MNEYGFMFGTYPAFVKSYDAPSRTCRVEIPNLTDGGDVFPVAEILYSIGDKSRNGENTTEIEITVGDAVWIEFIAGDQRYPLITGFRNPKVGNSTAWRRWHHANIEMLADALMNLIAKSDVLIKSDTHITLKAPKITLDAPETTATGDVIVQKLLSFFGGLFGKNSGGGKAANVEGSMSITGGDVTVDGVSSKNHTHDETGSKTKQPNK